MDIKVTTTPAHDLALAYEFDRVNAELRDLGLPLVLDVLTLSQSRVVLMLDQLAAGVKSDVRRNVIDAYDKADDTKAANVAAILQVTIPTAQVTP